MKKNNRDPTKLPPRPIQEDYHEVPVHSRRYITTAKHHTYRSHGTTTWVLIYSMNNGGYFRSSNGNVHFTQRGDIYMYEPGVAQEHGTYPGCIWDFHWFHFHANLSMLKWLKLPKISKAWNLRFVHINAGPSRKKIENILEDIHVSIQVGGTIRNEMALGGVVEICQLLWETLESGQTKPLDPRISAAVEDIEQNLEKKFKVGSLASKANLSEQHFARLFKQETGLSVVEYILKARLREAATMLEKSVFTISEIAFKLGFCSPFYFSYQFHKRYVMSPKQYRQNHKIISVTATGKGEEYQRLLDLKKNHKS